VWVLWPLVATVAALAAWFGTHSAIGNPYVRFAAVVATVVGLAVLVALPGVAALSVAGRPRQLSVRFTVLAVGSGIPALLDFWVWVASPAFGRVVSVALLVGSVMVVVALRPTALFDDPELAHALLLGVLLALGFAAFAYVGGGLSGTRLSDNTYIPSPTGALALRYWLAPDSVFPLTFVEHVAAHVPPHVPLAPYWHSSDRPPLQTALMLLVLPFVGRVDFAYSLFGIVLQALWVPALFVVLVSVGVRAARVVLVIVATALTGAMFVNTVYVWPKMLAGALALAALAVLLERGSLVLAAAVATLALLAHGGIAFSLIVLVVFAWRLRPTIRQAALALGAAAAIYAPWVLYQHYLDPPGNRVLKWQLAGLLAIDQNSVLHDVVHQYAQDPWRTLVLDKVYNLKMLVGNPSTWTSLTETPQWRGFAGGLHAATTTSLVLACGPLLVGVLALISARARAALRPALPLVLFVVGSVILWVITLFGGQVFDSTLIWQGPFAVLIVVIALTALCTSYLPRAVAVTVFSASFALFIFEWTWGLGLHPVQPGVPVRADWAMLPVLVLAAGGFAAVAYREIRRNGPSAREHDVVIDENSGSRRRAQHAKSRRVQPVSAVHT
jgi:hypothetical protein